MPRPIAVFVAAMTIAGGASSCATSSAAEPEETDRGAVGVPTEDEREERPVWAEGPIDDTTAEDRSDDDSTADRDTAESSRRPSEPRRPIRTQAEGLEGVFPDETVNLDFRKASIRRIFRIFQVKARLDLVLDSEVEGRLTVRTDETPIREAFEALLKAADLTYERRDDVVIVQRK